MTTEALPPPPFFSGERLLRIVATALNRLSAARLPGTPVYDNVVQGAYNQIVLNCLRKGISPPASVPDMASWATDRPIRDWPLDLPADFEAGDGFLVDRFSGTPTQQCVEWAVSSSDPAAELYENELILGVLGACRAGESPQTYTAFRRLLTNQPVLTGTEYQRLCNSLELILVQDQLQQIYEAVPSAYLRDGLAMACGRCRCLLVPVGSDGYRCELDRCRRESVMVGEARDVRQDGGLRQLSRPLRMFITGPGLAETQLEGELGRRGLAAEMWPNFDAYDLRIAFPNGRIWAVDVKDRANPILLGRGARPLPTDPPYHRAFLVVPRYRFDERDGYRRIFGQHLQTAVAGKVQLLSDQEFLRDVDTELRSMSGPLNGVHNA